MANKVSPFDLLHVHGPTCIAQKRGDTPIAIAAILGGERGDVGGERVFVGPPARRLPLGRAMLSEHMTGETFRHLELPPDVVDTTTTAGGAQKFPEAFAQALGPMARRCAARFRETLADQRIERMFGRLKDWRRIATRYVRCAHTPISAICIAATVIFWL